MNVRIFLRQSLIESLRRKPIDEISVREIIEPIGSCKSTFYKYYQDKYDLLADTFDAYFYKKSREESPQKRFCTADGFLKEMIRAFSACPSVVLNAFSSSDVNSVRVYHEGMLCSLLSYDYLGVPLEDAPKNFRTTVRVYANNVTTLLLRKIADDDITDEEFFDLLCDFQPACFMRRGERLSNVAGNSF